MKKKLIVVITCLIGLAAFSSLPLKAQNENLPCREPNVSKEKIQQLIQSRKIAAQNRTLSTTNKQLRVYFHICRNNDGTNAGATEADVQTEFQTLLADYTSGNICFVYAGLNYVNNTTLNNINLDGDDDAEDLFEPHTIPGCLNVFYTYKIRGVNGSSGGKIGGYSFNIPGTFCIVAKGNLGGNTTSHEIGHCLGLFHTFSTKGFGEEFINGDDCDIRGDLICDTRADPYSHKEDDCFDTDNGFYNGYCEDPDGHKNFSPPYNNIMSYWHHDPETFTSDQFTAVRTTINAEDDLQNVSSSQNLTLTAPFTYNFEYVYKSAINKLQTQGKVEFAGVSNGGLFGSQVVLKPGFNAHPQLLPVKIAATECNTAGFTLIAKTSTQQQIKSVTKVVNNNLIIYPNPATNYFVVQYNQPEKFDAVINVKNINGAIVFSVNRKNIFQLQEKINLSDKARGVYLVEVVVNEKRLTGKVVLQ